jgi:hypothetical protein
MSVPDSDTVILITRNGMGDAEASPSADVDYHLFQAAG